MGLRLCLFTRCSFFVSYGCSGVGKRGRADRAPVILYYRGTGNVNGEVGEWRIMNCELFFLGLICDGDVLVE